MAAAPLVEAEEMERRLGTGPGAFRLQVPMLHLWPGDRVAVIGPSGCGKSTLLALLALALRPGRARRFLLAGRDAGALWARRDEAGLAALRAAALGFVPQTAGLLPFLTLRANIRLTQEIAGRPDPALIDHLAARLGLAAELDRRPEDVSVGQRQRAAIARALAHRPPLLLADEPTASVHPAQADEILGLLCDVADAGTAVLVSTHDAARAAAAGMVLLRCAPDPGGLPESTLVQDAAPEGVPA